MLLEEKDAEKNEALEKLSAEKEKNEALQQQLKDKEKEKNEELQQQLADKEKEKNQQEKKLSNRLKEIDKLQNYDGSYDEKIKSLLVKLKSYHVEIDYLSEDEDLFRELDKFVDTSVEFNDNFYQ